MRESVLTALGLVACLLPRVAFAEDDDTTAEQATAGSASENGMSAFTLELDAELEPLFWVRPIKEQGKLTPFLPYGCRTRVMGPSLRKLPPGDRLTFRHADGHISVMVIECSGNRAALARKKRIAPHDQVLGK